MHKIHQKILQLILLKDKILQIYQIYPKMNQPSKINFKEIHKFNLTVVNQMLFHNVIQIKYN